MLAYCTSNKFNEPILLPLTVPVFPALAEVAVGDTGLLPLVIVEASDVEEPPVGEPCELLAGGIEGFD